MNSVTDADFDSSVLQSDQPVLVDFWAEWCPPCRMIAPIVEDIAGEFGERARVFKMDVDANPSTAAQLGIMSLPTLVLFKDGRPVDRQVGYRPNLRGDLKERLTALL
jgi:thioredoxin 1